MSKFSVAMKRFGGFLKRNAFYFLIVLCIASVATVIALAVTRNNVTQDQTIAGNDQPVVNPDVDDPPADENNDPDDNKPEPPAKQLTFNMPCNGTVKNGYAYDEVVYSSTFEQWESHVGVDFVGDELSVYAAADGTVDEVGYDELQGNYIVISHDDGYKTIYKSLDDGVTLKKGDKVTQGQLIGMMSATQGEESLEGAHLHFEMTKDGESINPLDVLVLEEK